MRPHRRDQPTSSLARSLRHSVTMCATEGEAPAASGAIEFDLDDLDSAKSAINLGQALCREGR